MKGNHLAIVLGCLGLLFVVGLRFFVIELFRIPAGSMIPTINVGDRVFADKTAYLRGEIQRGDIIIFRYPPDPSKDYIKRIVAIGGDTVEVDGPAIRVNGKPLLQERLARPCAYPEENGQHACVAYRETNDAGSYEVVFDSEPRSMRGTYEVKQGSVFVMGDNRDNSSDSRFWGAVPIDHIKGRAWKAW